MNKLISIALVGLALSQLHGCAAVVVGGAATGAAVATDRRSTGTVVSDQEIEFRAMSRLGEGLPKDIARVAPTSFNRQVLLTGQVPDEAARARAAEIVRAVPEVRGVFNEVTVGSVATAATFARDASLTSTVKTRLFGNDTAPGMHIKVKTESGVVYLMGLVTRAEANAATDVTRNTSGVTKVVTLFEFTD